MSENQSPQEMQRLQQEAVRRVQEMQSRARGPAPPRPQEATHSQRRPEFFVGGPSAAQRPERQEAHPHHEKEPEHNHAPPRHPEHPPAKEPEKGVINDIFEAIMSDSERILILVLILLLVSEEADTGLILALMYLII